MIPVLVLSLVIIINIGPGSTLQVMLSWGKNWQCVLKSKKGRLWFRMGYGVIVTVIIMELRSRLEFGTNFFPRRKTMTSQQCDWSLALMNLAHH